mmetsp:Transcript_10847/g.26292  ORF Transcript_10847/g.26292 Transcript_10847/m.26292 type:complete len:284 (+) Transcript_10847:571-1422(+)
MSVSDPSEALAPSPPPPPPLSLRPPSPSPSPSPSSSPTFLSRRRFTGGPASRATRGEGRSGRSERLSGVAGRFVVFFLGPLTASAWPLRKLALPAPGPTPLEPFRTSDFLSLTLAPASLRLFLSSLLMRGRAGTEDACDVGVSATFRPDLSAGSCFGASVGGLAAAAAADGPEGCFDEGERARGLSPVGWRGLPGDTMRTEGWGGGWEERGTLGSLGEVDTFLTSGGAAAAEAAALPVAPAAAGFFCVGLFLFLFFLVLSLTSAAARMDASAWMTPGGRSVSL